MKLNVLTDWMQVWAHEGYATDEVQWELNCLDGTKKKVFLNSKFIEHNGVITFVLEEKK